MTVHMGEGTSRKGARAGGQTVILNLLPWRTLFTRFTQCSVVCVVFLVAWTFELPFPRIHKYILAPPFRPDLPFPAEGCVVSSVGGLAASQLAGWLRQYPVHSPQFPSYPNPSLPFPSATSPFVPRALPRFPNGST